MALTPEQKSSRLFKKSLGAGETLIARDFFEEPKLGKNFIFTDQIWAESDRIPETAPVLSNEETSGVIKYYEKLTLSHIPGSQDKSYFHENLKDTIPFNHSDGSYNYSLYKNDGTTSISFGEGDWLVDTTSGLLTFYGTLPSGVNSSNPPKISFYKYIGEKGVPSASGFIIKDPVISTTSSGETINNYDTNLSGYTSLPSDIDGVSVFNNGDRFLIKDQVDKTQNGIFEVSGTTLVRAEDSDGTPYGEVSTSNYVFVESGSTNISSSWVLSKTDASDPMHIIPGVDTQEWVLFSRSSSYTADGEGIEIQGQEFKLELDGETLSKSSTGLKVSESVITVIDDLSGLTSSISDDITSLESAIDNEVSDRIYGDESLETLILEMSGNTLDLKEIMEDGQFLGLVGGELTGVTNIQQDLSSAIDNEISDRIAGDDSLEYQLNNLSGVTESTAGSGLTYNSSNESLNVNVDDWTIKIIDNTLIGPQQWVQDSNSVDVSGTSGSTNISLDYDPVTPVSAYINGIEYLVNPSSSGPSTGRPFFYDEYPPNIGTEIWFDPVTAGFGIDNSVDTVVIKYLFVSNIQQ